MNVQNDGKKGFFRVFKSMSGLHKAAVCLCGLIVIGGATAATVGIVNSQDKPAIGEISSVATSSTAPSSTEPSSVAPTSTEPSSTAPSSTEPSSVAPSSVKPSSTEPSSVAPPPAPTTEKPTTPKPTSPKPPTTPVAMPEGYQARFAELYKQNNEFAGWIKYTGKLDYPVVKHTDDVYYLDRNFHKQHYAWGTPYMDFRVTPDQSTNTLIWAHSNPKTGEMFQATKGLRKVDYYKQHPTIEFASPYSDGTYKILALFVEDTTPGTNFFQYSDFIDQTDAAYIDNFMTEVKKRSFINTTVDYATTDKFLTLSTCWDTNGKNYNRLITVARKLREGETADVDTSGATQNTAQQLPPNGLYDKSWK